MFHALADPRRLERWWGPPTHSATVVDHDLRPGGRVTYYMTAMNRLVAMGMEEGIRSAVGQIDGTLAGEPVG